MAQQSSIEWTDGTWPIVQGCDYESPGCSHCYAVPLLWRLSHNPNETISGPLQGVVAKNAGGKLHFTGKVALREDRLEWPLKWRKPMKIFVPSHGDLFHPAVPDEFIDKVFAIMALCPQHTFQVLTKRADRMRQWFAERWQGTPAQRIKVGSEIMDIPAGGETGREHQVEIAVEGVLDQFPKMTDTSNDELWTDAGSLKIRQYKWPLPNVWLGVSVEDQERADERIPDLLATPAAVRFISAEPLLGALNIVSHLAAYECHDCFAGRTRVTSAFFDEPCPACRGTGIETPRLDWVIAGGESGPNARPCHPEWARSLRDQCAAANVLYFWKQWGEWAPVPGSPRMVGQGDCFVAPDGRRDVLGPDLSTELEDVGTPMRRVGKKAAGALLDGREHREFPA